MSAKKNILCIMGPTASGKTDLALKLAKTHPIEIISVDSAMIYKGMDIGTAKPSPSILNECKHHLVDILEPEQAYSVGDFQKDALRAIETIVQSGKIPCLVGGTMMYFRALFEGLADLPHADSIIRQKIDRLAKQEGWQAMHARLAKIDPASAKRIHPNDPQRLQRALEVYETTGVPLSIWCEQSSEGILSAYNVLSIALIPSDRALLHQRIAERFKEMLSQGFIDEVKNLYERGDLDTDMPSMRAVGYRQVWKHLAGELNYDDMSERAIIATRQLAKRQLTWLRGWDKLHRIESEATNVFEQAQTLFDNHLKGENNHGATKK